MTYVLIKLDKRTGVEEFVNAFTGGHLAAWMLLCRGKSIAVTDRFLILASVIGDLLGRGLRLDRIHIIHVCQPTAWSMPIGGVNR